MADMKKFLDLPGLTSYDTAIKNWVKQNTGEVSDWSENNPASKSYIKNKPDLAKVALSGDYTDLSNTPSIPQVAQEIADAETGYATGSQVYNYVQEVTSALDDVMRFKGTVSSAQAVAAIDSPSSGDVYIASASFTLNNEAIEAGDMLVYKTYGTPGWEVIQTNIDGAVTGPASAVNNHVAVFDGTSGKLIKDSGVTLSTVASTGSYNDLIDKPSIPGIPTDVSAFNNDAGYLTTEDITDKVDSDSLANIAFSGDYDDLENKPELFSGSYEDLTNKPTIPDAPEQADWEEDNIDSLSYIKNKPTLFSGDYQDLTNKPHIPADVSEFNNDAQYITPTALSQIISQVAVTGDYNDLDNLPTIPTVTTATAIADGDTGFTTGSQVYNAFQNALQEIKDIWNFHVSYTRTSVTFSNVKKNNVLYNGNLSAYAIIETNNSISNMTCLIANRTFVDGAYTVDFSNSQTMIDFLGNADTIIFRLGPGSGSGFLGGPYALPKKAASITDGAHGFTTGDQVYDYLQSSFEDIPVISDTEINNLFPATQAGD